MIRQELNPVTCKLDRKQINLRRSLRRYKWLIRPLIHRNAIASLDWIGKSAPVPLHYLKKGEEGRKKKEVLHLSRCYTHTSLSPNLSCTISFPSCLSHLIFTSACDLWKKLICGVIRSFKIYDIFFGHANLWYYIIFIPHLPGEGC